LLRSF